MWRRRQLDGERDADKEVFDVEAGVYSWALEVVGRNWSICHMPWDC